MLSLVLYTLTSLIWRCDDAPCNSLSGTVGDTFPLDFETVEAFRSDENKTLKSVIIKYIRLPEIPKKTSNPAVIVTNAPIRIDESIDLTKQENTLFRVPNTKPYPAIQSGSIWFEALGNVTQPVSGRFEAVFKTGETLQGKFCTIMNGR